MGPIETIVLDDDHYVEIHYDTFPINPRDNNYNVSKFCIKYQRNRHVPNELEIDFGMLTEDDEEDQDHIEMVETLSKYHIFCLDDREYHDHELYITSDVSYDVWFIAVPKRIEWDYGPWYSGSKDYTIEKARKIAEEDLKQYNQYCNWKIYCFKYYESFPPIVHNDRCYRTEPDPLSEGWNLYDEEDIAEHLPEEYREKFLSSLTC